MRGYCGQPTIAQRVPAVLLVMGSRYSPHQLKRKVMASRPTERKDTYFFPRLVESVRETVVSFSGQLVPFDGVDDPTRAN